MFRILRMLQAPTGWACLIGLILCTPNLRAQDGQERIAELEGQVITLTTSNSELRSAYEELLAITRQLQDQVQAIAAGAASAAQGVAGAGDDYFIPRTASEFEAQGLTQGLGNEYTKPFLTKLGRNTYLGGYIDLEFTDPANDGGNREFDQHRLVPLVYADVTENVKVAAEVEIEHGSELEVEFAQIDLLFNEHINARAGIMLLPLGKLNEVHDSPIQDLTARPLVDRYIIPTTLRDAGVGVWGKLAENVSYQATVTNGFRGLADDGTSEITATDGLRNAAPQKDKIGEPFENQNDKLAYTARVAWQPVLGAEVGVSGLHDYYDQAGDNRLEILALDATLDGKAVPVIPDNMEILYEGAWADVQRDAFAKASGVAGDMHGYYVQANVHFEPGFLASWRENGGLADEGAHFTFVTRYGAVDLDTYTRRRTTLGINYRPNPTDTVIKLDYQFNDDYGSASGTNNDNAWLFSVASYF